MPLHVHACINNILQTINNRQTDRQTDKKLIRSIVRSKLADNTESLLNVRGEADILPI